MPEARVGMAGEEVAVGVAIVVVVAEDADAPLRSQGFGGEAMAEMRADETARGSPRRSD